MFVYDEPLLTLKISDEPLLTLKMILFNKMEFTVALFLCQESLLSTMGLQDEQLICSPKCIIIVHLRKEKCGVNTPQV